MRADELDWRLLHAFRLVARHGSLSQAATRLNQTVPAVSLKIKRLEERLAMPLFERLPHRMVLTQTGRGFLEQVDLLFDQADRALDYLSQKSTIRGRLSVSIGSDHSWFFVPRITRFLMRYPDVEFSLQVYQATNALKALERGELDVSLGIFPFIPAAFEERVIMRTPLSLLCQDDDPLVAHAPPRLSELKHRRLILLPSHAETRRVTEELLMEAGITVDTAIEVANCMTAGMLVREGVGVGIVHTRCIEHQAVPGTSWRDLDRGQPQVSFSAAYRRQETDATLVNAFLDHLLDGSLDAG